MRSKSSTSRLDEIEFHFHNARGTTCLAVISVTLSCAPPHASPRVVYALISSSVTVVSPIRLKFIILLKFQTQSAKDLEMVFGRQC